MRILVDEEGLEWENAWDMTRRIFSYTCHTLMSEALETWPVEMMANILPRHLQIIFDINDHFLEYVRTYITTDNDFISRVSLIEEGYQRKVRMGWLSVVGSHKVNGVAAIHSDLMVSSTFADFVSHLSRTLYQCNERYHATPLVSRSEPEISCVI